MERLSDRAARGIALASLAVACVVVGPVPQLATAFERTYAVAVAEDKRTRGRDRRVPVGGWQHRVGPPHRRPHAGRPHGPA